MPRSCATADRRVRLLETSALTVQSSPQCGSARAWTPLQSSLRLYVLSAQCPTKQTGMAAQRIARPAVGVMRLDAPQIDTGDVQSCRSVVSFSVCLAVSHYALGASGR